MKVVYSILFALVTCQAHAQSGNGYEVPRPERPRWQNSTLLFVEAMVKVVDLVIHKSNPQTSERQQDLQSLREDLADCAKMRMEHVPNCLESQASEIVKLAFTPEDTGKVCSVHQDISIWAGDGRNFAYVPGTGKECSKLTIGTRVRFVTGTKIRFRMYNSEGEGYETEVLEGACQGAKGFIASVYADQFRCR